MIRRARPAAFGILGLFLVMAAASCTRQVVRPSEMAAVAPMLSVERFLQAVNANDYQAMSQLFGTADGPVKGDRVFVERWMDTLARVLRHQDYRIVSESAVPGREEPTTRIGVDLTIGGQVVPDVAFHVVQTDEGRWMVQWIDVEAITRR